MPVIKKAFVWFVAVWLFAGCAFQSSTGGGVVGAGRKQLMLVPSDVMDEGAREAYAKMMNEARQKGLLNRDAKTLARLRAMASRLSAQTGVFRPDAPSWRWEVNLISSDELNAWCMPGGKIAFYTGIIETLGLDDDEIAAVMGHEMAHALREHARERSSQGILAQGALGLGAQLLGMNAQTLDLASWVTNVAIMLPNSRGQETESDRMGVELAARSGYDPYAAVRVWEKMQRLSKGAPPEFLSTHPSSDNRINDLKVYARRVMPLYEKAKR